MAKKSRQRWFLKEWRKHRGYSQERLAEMIGSSKGYISDLERGARRYNQELLEGLAEALSCDPADLLVRDPSDPEGLWSLLEGLKVPERKQAIAVINAIKGTGTDG